MALDKQKVKARLSAERFEMSSLEDAAMMAGKDPVNAREEVEDEAIDLVLDMIDSLPLVARWLIGDKWAARFAALIAKFLGEKVQDWLG